METDKREKFLIKADAYSKLKKAQFEMQREYFLEYCDPLDEDGYPTTDALSLIENWHYEYAVTWFDFIHSLWYASDWGWHSEVVPHRFREGRNVMKFDISTAGWSGNESVIKAMQNNEMLWWTTHYQTTRGGHYIFEVEIRDEKDPS